MRELLELQTGQVAFLSGLMAGFALSVAAHILRHGMRNRMTQFVFVSLLLTSLLFLVALYIDVRLTIELAGVSELSDPLRQHVSKVRSIGTTSATIALFLFVMSAGLLGWSATPFMGLIGTTMAAGVLILLYFVWHDMAEIAALVASGHGAADKP